MCHCHLGWVDGWMTIGLHSWYFNGKRIILTWAVNIWPARYVPPSVCQDPRGTKSAEPEQETARFNTKELKLSMTESEVRVHTSSWERFAFSSSFLDFFRASGPTTDKTVLNLFLKKDAFLINRLK